MKFRNFTEPMKAFAEMSGGTAAVWKWIGRRPSELPLLLVFPDSLIRRAYPLEELRPVIPEAAWKNSQI